MPSSFLAPFDGAFVELAGGLSASGGEARGVPSPFKHRASGLSDAYVRAPRDRSSEIVATQRRCDEERAARFFSIRAAELALDQR